MLFVWREAWTGLRRNITMSIAMVLTTAISLGALGAGLLIVRTIDRTEELYSDRVEIQVALASDISANDTTCSQPVCQGLMTTLKNSPLVDSVRYESQQEAYERYRDHPEHQAIISEHIRPRLAARSGLQFAH